MTAVATDLLRSPLIWIGDIAGHCTHVNDAWVELTRRPRAELLGEGWLASVHVDDRDALLQTHASVLGGSAPASIETRIAAAGGSLLSLHVTVSPRFSDSGELVGLMATAHPTADTSHPSSYTVAEDIFERIIDGVCVAGFDGYFKRVNPSWVKTLGWSVDELLQRPILDFVHPDDHDGVISARRQLHTGTSLQHLINRYICKDGSYRWMEWRSVAHAERRLVYAVARDITEQKINEERLHKARQDQLDLQRRLVFAERMASVGTLAAGVAHEINNPLTYVLTNIDLVTDLLVASPAPLPHTDLDELQDMLTEARAGADRIRSIVAGLKTFSRAEDDRVEVIDLGPVIDRAINMTANEVRHRARLTTTLGPLPRVRANEARIGQVLVNLLLNAAQSIPETGSTAHLVSLSATTNARGEAEIAVSDSGKGIDPEHLSRIFDPFFTTRPHAGGTGLGLSICHSIVTTHGGELRVDSVPGEGSTFILTLPAVDAPPPLTSRSSPVPQTPPPPGRRLAILVIDDEPRVGRALQRLIGDHNVRVAHSGKEALALLQQGLHVDLIFSDLMMPEMSGITLYEHIQRLLPHLAPRMVFISGGAFTAQARAFVESVDNPILDKPFDRDVLRSLLEHAALASED